MNTMKRRKNVIAAAALVAAIAALIMLVRGGERVGTTETRREDLYPVDTFTHAHGLAVDVADPNRLYIATHHGIFVLRNEKDLYRVGKSRDDYMGFSLHPSDPNVMFSSGHPRKGGNFGFLRSKDRGFTWEKLSEGINGPVDFHEMAVSPVNSNLIYGWYEGTLQRSKDGGLRWEALNVGLPLPHFFVADPREEGALYALSIYGLYVSKDKGATWTKHGEALSGIEATAFAIHPKEPRTMVAYFKKFGLMRSGDAGITWEKLDERFGGDPLFFIAFDPQRPEMIYALTATNAIYRSADGGESWQKIR